MAPRQSQHVAELCPIGCTPPPHAALFFELRWLHEDDEDPLHEAIVDQRMRMSEEEVCNLWDIIPPCADFIGVPFVTRLTSTMVDRHDMVCYTYKCRLSDDMLSVESNDMLCGS